MCMFIHAYGAHMHKHAGLCKHTDARGRRAYSVLIHFHSHRMAMTRKNDIMNKSYEIEKRTYPKQLWCCVWKHGGQGVEQLQGYLYL